MLFTTGTFVLVYLPLVLAGFFALGRWSPTLAAGWLFVASVVFYGYWMPEFTLLLLGSIAANFFFGQRIASARGASGSGSGAPRLWLVLGIVFNLGLLAYFKYANFFVHSLNAALGFDWHLAKIILPVGISFYSFTQIAYLVDTWAGKVNEARPLHYGLFVTYFPHLVAGPVLHHAQMMPQFGRPEVYRFNAGHFVAGLCIFALGLFKKVVLADGIAPYADAVFHPVDHAGALPTVAEAWLAALAYTFQLYFDFSGYSDMAIGLSWMFNIRLPYNFDSPYKSLNISDFWRRWHISLSTFLRDYLYVPLGGNRKGASRRYFNLATTMVLGGLWHGASWSFVIWGALHGAYLMLNHGFRALMDHLGFSGRLARSKIFGLLAWMLTFVAVVYAWVFFRAQTLDGAASIVSAMTGFGMAQQQPGGYLLANAGLSALVGALWCVVLGAIAFFAPNSNRLGEQALALVERQGVTAFLAGAATAVIAALLVINQARDSVSAFIYFNF
ncbi:MBOAT family O-acyltransferase [Roseateles sp.]|jgi:alginate O-acetyltransferase complex protein AlgI|uniref:MBOAT family O-acyltransferase n=1 Tax=Roseateles sp. TaxID=1971397 RepID=UPI0037C6847F